LNRTILANMTSTHTKVQKRLQTLISNIATDFDYDKLSKSPARFNPEKLNWFNREYIKMMDLREFVSRAIQLNKGSMIVSDSKEILARQYLAWNLDKNRITTLSEIGVESDCILKYQIPDVELLKWKKISLEESLANLTEITPFILSLVESNHKTQSSLFDTLASWIADENSNLTPLESYTSLVEQYEIAIKQWLNDNQKDAGSYLWPLRVVISGKSRSASPFELLTILSPMQVAERLQSAIQL
jgi:glutamyl/glutaminyl-tRNA synthetase